MQNALNHFENVGYSLRRRLSVKGVGELFSVFGFFWLALLLGWRRGQLPYWFTQLGWPSGAFVAVVVVHMLLSSDLGRMSFLAAPVFAIAFALVLTHQLGIKQKQVPGSISPEQVSNAAP